jgi:hypothetical protein
VLEPEEVHLSTEKDRTELSASADARRQIGDLVDRFARNLDVYTRPDYKETQVGAQRVLDLHKKLAAATIPADKALYQRQIEATDAEIDALVYELYGLTEEEIAIVRGDQQ